MLGGCCCCCSRGQSCRFASRTATPLQFIKQRKSALRKFYFSLTFGPTIPSCLLTNSKRRFTTLYSSVSFFFFIPHLYDSLVAAISCICFFSGRGIEQLSIRLRCTEYEAQSQSNADVKDEETAFEVFLFFRGCLLVRRRQNIDEAIKRRKGGHGVSSIGSV